MTNFLFQDVIIKIAIFVTAFSMGVAKIDLKALQALPPRAQTKTRLRLVLGSLPHLTYKIDSDKSRSLFYGASNGIRFEPYCVELMHLCLHDDETIEQIRKFLNCNNFSDISYI